MYITIERARELVTASEQIKRGPEAHRKFSWLRAVKDVFQTELARDLSLAYLADKRELKEGIANNSLPVWVYEAFDVDSYYAYDITIQLSKLKRSREDAIKATHRLTPLIEECDQGMNEWLPLATQPKSVVLDEVDGFAARVEDAEEMRRTNITIQKPLYDMLVGVERRMKA